MVPGMRRPALAAVAVVLLAAGWSAAWFHFAGQIEARMAAWAEAQRAQGLTVEYRRLAVGGFPLAWRVTVDEPAMAGAGAARWSWRGERALVSLRPWRLQEVPVVFPGRHRLAAGAGGVAEAVELRAERPDGLVELDPGGRLRLLRLDLSGVDVRHAAAATPAHIAEMRLDLRPRPSAAPTHRTETLDLVLLIEDLRLPEPPRYALGPRIGAAQVEASVRGALPPGPLSEALAAWRDGGGTIEIRRVALRWGALAADGDGTLALDAENRPLGAFTAQIRGYAETIDALSASGAVRPRDGAAAKIVLNLLARQTEAGSVLKVPLTAQDGRLTVAGFPLLRLPPLAFD